MKIPSVGTPVTLIDQLRAWMPFGGRETLQKTLEGYFQVAWCGLSGSGTSAIYASLLALRKHSDRTRVVLPAYTAPSLILPIRKAGLTPVLCDISPDTLNAGSDEMLPCVTEDTLVAMPVHMYGLVTDAQTIAEQLKDTGTYIIEDAASAMGARENGVPVATRSDIGIYSFNRGKNLSTFTGGAVLTNRTDLVSDIQNAIAAFPKPNLKYGLKIRSFTAALSLVGHPMGYSLLHPLASRFKYTSLHTDFHTWAYGDFQARLGCRLVPRLQAFTQKRIANAQMLRNFLADIEGLQLPIILPGSQPAHNQFPILLPDEPTRNAVHQAVLATGLEATLLYPDPIHRLYKDIWDGTGSDPFPNATDISRRLLLIPVHPLVPHRVLERAAETIKETLNRNRALHPSSTKPAVALSSEG